MAGTQGLSTGTDSSRKLELKWSREDLNLPLCHETWALQITFQATALSTLAPEDLQIPLLWELVEVAYSSSVLHACKCASESERRGLSMWHSMLNYHQQCPYPVLAYLDPVAPPLLTQLPAHILPEAAGDGSILGSLPPSWGTPVELWAPGLDEAPPCYC